MREKRGTGLRNRCALFGLTATAMLAFTATNTLAGPQDYWTTGDWGTTLAKIDVSTGATTTFAPHGQSNAFGAAFTPDGTLWSSYYDSSSSSFWLGTFDLTTGAINPVGSGFGAEVQGLEADNSGNLYGVGETDQYVYEINKSTGVATPLFDTGVVYIEDLAFDNSGTLWALEAYGGLYTIDIQNQTTNFVANITGGPGIMAGLGFNAAGTMYLFDWQPSTTFYTVNTSTGAATTAGNTSLAFVAGGDFEFGPQGVPLPPSALLTLVGFGCILIVRRRYFR